MIPRPYPRPHIPLAQEPYEGRPQLPLSQDGTEETELPVEAEKEENFLT